jgi:endonuclease-3
MLTRTNKKSLSLSGKPGMSTNRAALYAKINKVLKKHYKPATPLSERSVLEHMLYACCLENSRPETADEAFAKLQQVLADWNEVRVTTVTELAEVMSMLIDPADSARRLKQALQSVFETKYSFDLEYLKKMNLGKAIKEVEGFRGVTPFVAAYVNQHGLGGHALPANRGAYGAMVSVGAITASEAAARRIPGLERAIPKTRGIEFASLLQQLGVDFQSSPHSAKLRGILQEINPNAELPKKEKPRPERARPGNKTKASSKPEGDRQRKTPGAQSRPQAKPAGKSATKPLTRKKPK